MLHSARRDSDVFNVCMCEQHGCTGTNNPGCRLCCSHGGSQATLVSEGSEVNRDVKKTVSRHSLLLSQNSGERAIQATHAHYIKLHVRHPTGLRSRACAEVSIFLAYH